MFTAVSIVLIIAALFMIVTVLQSSPWAPRLLPLCSWFCP